MSIVIGIDPGSTYLGVAILEVDLLNNDVSSIIAKTITPSETYAGLLYQDTTYAKLTSAERILLISDAVMLIIRKHEPVLIAIESPFYNRRFPAAYAVLLSQLSSLLKNIMATAPHVEIVTLPPAHVKKAVGAKVKGGKIAVYEALKTLGLDILVESYEDQSEHAIDAIAIAYTGVLNYH